MNTTTALIVLDGWGHRDHADDNAITLANTPTWDALEAKRPYSLISGSGTDVGLPAGQMGNSEVGHTTLGAGRVIHQDLTRITAAIEDGSFLDNQALALAMQLPDDKSLHLLGLLSPGGVHSHEDHIIAAVDMARAQGVKTLWLHAFLDGRDVPPRSAEPSLTRLHNHIKAHIKAGGAGGIASITGRYYAMDRDNRWERIQPAYDMLVHGVAAFQCQTPEAGLLAAYDRGESDEFVRPTLLGEKPHTINSGDSVIFMNFRADRARELTRCFTAPNFEHFERGKTPQLHQFVTLTQYADDIYADAPNVSCAFAPESIHNSLGEYVASQGKTQLRLAETEKYAHVTFFFSGGREATFTGEDRLLVPSPKVATYDLKPEMSAVEVTDELVKAIEAGKHELIVVNYANGDMVGHTGKLDASIKAVECIDACLARIVTTLEAAGGQCLITADHGNVEQMSDRSTGQPHTAHTAEPVPLVYVGPQQIKLKGGVLSDVAPTLLALMGLKQPTEMTGQSLIA